MENIFKIFRKITADYLHQKTNMLTVFCIGQIWTYSDSVNINAKQNQIRTLKIAKQLTILHNT